MSFFPLFFILTSRTGSDTAAAGLHKLIALGNSLPIILILALFMICGSSLNGTAASTFSREGAQFWISRVIPVSPREQVAAKFFHSYLIGVLGVVAALIPAVVLYPLRPAHVAIAAGLALITVVLLTAVGMIIDLARPLLDWTNPQKAIKQNLNVLLAMFADVGILIAFYFGIRFLMKTGADNNAIVCLLYGILILLSCLSALALDKFAEKRYREIE